MKQYCHFSEKTKSMVGSNMSTKSKGNTIGKISVFDKTEHEVLFDAFETDVYFLYIISGV